MRPLTILAVLLACLFCVPNADAGRRGGCRGGACSAPAAEQPSIKIDGKTYSTNQVPTEAACAQGACAVEGHEARRPVRRVLSAPFRFLFRRGHGRGCR